jgi:hypothetical protein
MIFHLITFANLYFQSNIYFKKISVQSKVLKYSPFFK